MFGSVIRVLAAAVLLCSAGSVVAAADHKPITLEASQDLYKKHVVPFIAKHCASCHGTEKKPKADLVLATLDPDMKVSSSAGRWALVLDQVVMDEMPPDDKPRPTKAEVEAVVAWIKAEMKRSGKNLERREQVRNGNSVPHRLLFDPKSAAAFDAASRVRRLSPEIYEAFMRDVGKGVNGLGQPFSPVGYTTFADMGSPKIDEPITALLINNALAIVKKQTAFKIESGEFKKIGFVPREFEALIDPGNEPTDEQIHAAIRTQFEKVVKRKPTDEEAGRFLSLMRQNIKDAGRVTGVRYTLAAVFLLPEVVFRSEVGDGKPDALGRVRLAPRELAFALNYALSDRQPPSWLLDEAAKGKLDTNEGVAATVKRMLDDPKFTKPRILRFFREYFEYGKATEVFKDAKAFNGHDARTLIADADRLVEHVLEQDRQVLFELLTTRKAFVAYRTAEDTKKKRIEARKKFEEQKKKDPKKYANKTLKLPGRSIYESYGLDDFPDKQPTDLPGDQRAGLLTHPAWLVAFSKADENDVIHRGKWVRERLLGGVVPDVPITVDAQLPNEPHHTLRKRMRVTEETYCWQCHQYMNRVGYPFESYDHFGRFRKTETILDPEATAKNVDKKGKQLGPVMREVEANAKGGIEFVPDKSLEGDVDGAVAYVEKLAKSEYVEQVFIRHAFRYWMGRNESLGDAKSLQAIHNTYNESDGSMKALIVAMLTSDSFLYRVPSGN